MRRAPRLMVYVIILPLFGLWLVGSGLVLLGTRVVPLFRPLYPYAWRIVFWASAGVVLANAALLTMLGLGLVVLQLSDTGAPSTLRGLVTIGWTGGAMLGPFVASAAGWGIGALLGVALAFRTATRAAASLFTDLRRSTSADAEPHRRRARSGWREEHTFDEPVGAGQDHHER